MSLGRETNPLFSNEGEFILYLTDLDLAEQDLGHLEYDWRLHGFKLFYTCREKLTENAGKSQGENQDRLGPALDGLYAPDLG